MAVPNGPLFMVGGGVTVGALATQLWEIPGAATSSLEIVSLEITLGTSTHTTTTVQFATATAAATVWTSTTPTPYNINGRARASLFAPKLWATGTSTNGTGFTARGAWAFDVASGFFYNPPEEARFQIPLGTGNFFVVKFSVAPPGATVVYSRIIYREL